jgi:hypothetical protein
MISKPGLAVLAAAAALAAGPALAQVVHPKLAPGVTAAPAYVAPKGGYVVTNGARLFKQPAWLPGTETGVELKRGEHPQVLAETDEGLWLLIGRGGQGIGYASRSLLCPAKTCTDVKS